ncbi:glycosyltransferase [Selenomonas sp. KH1T6]|uniref:glycosyltransferase n=1 Tax=Selenomonas sp. KH1T6 TaxID=3158784 RepID=UPI0008A7BA1B|nr:Glycosyl transferase family 2 [Selenomonas ruminantium]
MPERKDCLLSLALIMRDAADEIETCLASCAGAVDEMVIADTGSKDGSVAVVRRFLEKWQQEQPGRHGELMEIEWQDDFAAARNQVLSRCRGEYVLTLDSDEYLTEDTRQNLRPLAESLSRGQWPEGIKPVELPDRPVFSVGETFDLLEVQRDNVEQDGSLVTREKHDLSVRLCRRQAGLIYRGEVHERLAFTDGTPTRIAVAEPDLLRIIHTGYRTGVREQKLERNLQILLREEAQGGSTNLKYYYMADTYHERKEWQKALEAAELCVKDGHRPVHDKDAPYRIMYEAARELEKAARLQAGLSTAEGGPLPEEKPEEPEALQEARRLWQYGENILRAALREFPDHPGAYYYLGLRRRNRGDKEGSWRALRAAEELAEAFPAKYPEEDFIFCEHLQDLQEILAEARQGRWLFYIARSDSLGGRYLKRQLELDWEDWLPWEEKDSSKEETEVQRPRGLLLPFLEIEPGNLRQFLPKVALALQQARGFTRTVLMLREPLPEVLALLSRHQQQGLLCAAVCARPGELFGGEKAGELAGLADELLDLMEERLSSSSPRKRLLLPYRQEEKLSLLFAGDLAGAAIFALCHDGGLEPLVVAGSEVTYGQLATQAAESAGFGGRLQYGKSRLPKRAPLPGGLRLMQGSLLGLQEALRFMIRQRKELDS